MKNLIQRFIREEEGQDLVEYAFLLLFIALVATAAIQGTGGLINTMWGNIEDAVGTASS